MKGKTFIATLAVILFAALVYGEEPRVYTDRDLENIKQSPIMDDESRKRSEEELKAFEEQRETEYRQQPTSEDQKKVEKETREVWENMKKALSGKQGPGN